MYALACEQPTHSWEAVRWADVTDDAQSVSFPAGAQRSYRGRWRQAGGELSARLGREAGYTMPTWNGKMDGCDGVSFPWSSRWTPAGTLSRGA